MLTFLSNVSCVKIYKDIINTALSAMIIEIEDFFQYYLFLYQCIPAPSANPHE